MSETLEPPAATPESTPPAPRFHAAARLLVFFALVAGSFALVRIAWRALGLPRGMSEGMAQALPMAILSVIAVVVGLGLTWVMFRVFERRTFRTLGFRLDAGVLRDVALGLVGGGFTPAAVALALLAFGAATIRPAAPDLLATTLPMTIAMAAISSWEEIALRGYFMQLIGEMGGPWIAAIVSGTLFGLMHAGNPGANPAGLIITGLNGILLAYLVVRTGSLWLACAYHAGWNLTAAILLGMKDSGLVTPGAIFATDLRGSEFWTGGSYGFEASFLSFVVEAIVLLVLIGIAPRIALDPVARPYFATTRRPAAEPSADSTR